MLIDGVDIKKYDEDTLRKTVAVVQQRAALFSGTIEDNLHMAKADATLEEMRHAADTAQATEFIDRLEKALIHSFHKAVTTFRAVKTAYYNRTCVNQNSPILIWTTAPAHLTMRQTQI